MGSHINSRNRHDTQCTSCQKPGTALTAHFEAVNTLQ
jgi:hypothetical protein